MNLPELTFIKLIRKSVLPLISAMFLILTGCNNYFLVREAPSNTSEETMRLLADSSRYCIIHFNDTVLSLNDIKVDAIAKSIRGTLGEVVINHRSYKSEPTGNKNRYLVKYQHPINEIHLYINDTHVSYKKEFHSLLRDLVRIEIFERDEDARPKVRAGHVVAGVLILGFFVMVVALITYDQGGGGGGNMSII